MHLSLTSIFIHCMDDNDGFPHPAHIRIHPLWAFTLETHSSYKSSATSSLLAPFHPPPPMDDIFRQLGSFNGQTSSATDASFSAEPPFVVPSSQFPSPLHEAAMIAATEPPMSVVQSMYALPNAPDGQLYASNQLPTSPKPSAPYQPIDNQLAFMPTPSLASASCSNEVFASAAELGYGSMGPFPMIQNFTNTCSTAIPPFIDIPNHSFSTTGDGNYYHLPLPQDNPSTALFGLANQAIPIQNQLLDTNLGRNLSHLFPMGELMEHNWEAITSYLAGQVRPGPDVPRIYKCNTCSLEFPNAQAFGGHMSSHSKLKKTEIPSASASKKARLDRKAKLADLQSSKKANASKASKKNKKTGGKPVEEVPVEEKELEKGLEIEAEQEKALVEDAAKFANPPTDKTLKENAGYVSDESVSSEFFLGDTSSSNPW